jgi:hypothetical protein
MFVLLKHSCLTAWFFDQKTLKGQLTRSISSTGRGERRAAIHLRRARERVKRMSAAKARLIRASSAGTAMALR